MLSCTTESFWSTYRPTGFPWGVLAPWQFIEALKLSPRGPSSRSSIGALKLRPQGLYSQLVPSSTSLVSSRGIDRDPGHVRDSLKTRVSPSHQFPKLSYEP